ncbi:MAG TPA: ABC transporter ATP-binding protein [Alphaproteobacteria bacterium]|nr:ABC transporter ATP-binding protein [Alphaproteobacteria bacterium]
MNNVLSQNLWSFIGHFLKPYKNVCIIYVSLALLAGCWAPFNSMLIKSIINSLSSSQADNISLLTWPAVLLVLNFIVFDNFTWRSIGYLNYKFQPVIKNQIISDVFRFVLGSSHQFFHDNLSGRLSNQITTLADNVERILHNISTNFIRGFALLIVAFISMYYVNPTFFYILALWFLAFFSFSILMSKRLIHLSDIHAGADSVISGQLVDSITNASNVRIFARRLFEVLRLEKYLLVTKETFQTKELFLVKLNFVQGMLIATMLGAMAYFLIHLYAQHLVTVGDFALILGLSMEVGHIAWFTMSQVDEFNQAVGKCKQSLSSLIVPQEIKDKKDATNLVITKGQITFSNVKFHYKGTEPLFQNKSVTIEAGQKVGLVGYSGGGKSTFANLILRLYDVTDGQILIDGQDIRDVTQDSLYNNIATIPQDPSLFHRTLMENIRYGRIDATDEEVREASRRAHAHEFIQDLPQGYDSLVGERGVKLSGGQRQRIAIARAILKNAPILILDEATSQLDSVTERFIQDSLWELMQEKTTIVIAHRLSTLLHMDRIIVFDRGKIVEDGMHQELLVKGGIYKTLWETQVDGFLPDKKTP